MITENNVYDIYNKFGVEDNEIVIEEFNKIIENPQASDEIKSKAYCGIGDVIIFLDPYLYDDAGYQYYKKALDCDADNLSARVGICLVYDEFPSPPNNILTEREYLENLRILINNFDEISDEGQKKNITQLMKNLIEYELKKIGQLRKATFNRKQGGIFDEQHGKD